MALADLDDILNFIAADRPKAAAEMAMTIRRTVDLLSSQPAMGKPGRIPGTRELVVSGTPFIVPYRCVDHEIQILRVFHGSRRCPVKLA